MAFMDWQAAYSVGVLSIDEQHRALLDIINRLHGVMSRGGAADELKGVLESWSPTPSITSATRNR